MVRITPNKTVVRKIVTNRTIVKTITIGRPIRSVQSTSGVATIGDIDNVNTTGVADNHLLLFDSTSQTWTTTLYSTLIQPLIDSAVNAQLHLDSAGVISIINTYPHLDSADVLSIINTFSHLDSADVVSIINTYPHLDSADVQGIIDSNGLVLTANDIMSLIQTLDSNGSGLNADTLDGQQGSFYLDYTNFTSTPTILDSATIQGWIDSAIVEQIHLDSAQVQQIISAFPHVDSATIAGWIDSAIALQPHLDSGNVQALIDLQTHLDSATVIGWIDSAIGVLNILDSGNVQTLIDASAYTANQIMDFVKTLDSNGSGLNADTLDGQQGTFYLDYNNFTNTPNVLDSAQIQAMTDSNEVGYTLDFVTGNGSTTTNDISVGNIIVSGTVDGRDIAADGIVLDSTSDFATVTLSTGIISGGALSVNATPTLFDVTAGTGYIVNHTTDPATIKVVSWNAFTGESVPALATAFATDIAIDSNGQLIKQSSFTNSDLRRHIILGGLDHSNQTTITDTFSIQVPIQAPVNSIRELAKALGDLNISGNVYSANGVNLKLNKSAGTSFSYGRNHINDEEDPHTVSAGGLTALTFGYVFNDGSGNGVFGAGVTDIDPNNYDGGAGSLVTVNNNKWTIQRILFFPNGNKTFIQYGTIEYNSLDDAIVGVQTEAFVALSGIKTAITRGYIVVKKGETDLTSANTRIFEASKFGGASGAAQAGGLDSAQVQGIVDLNETAYTLDFVTSNGNTTTNSITVEDATINGLITLADSTAAPSTTTNKLYAVGGRLYWNAFVLDSDKFGGSSNVDSAVIQAMIDSNLGTLNILDSGNVQTLIDASAYTANEIFDLVKTLDSNGSGLNAATLDGQEGSYYLTYANFTGTPNVLDSADVQGIVDSNALSANDIMSLIQTLDSNGSGLNADTLDGQQGTFYLDYNNFTNTPNVLDSALVQNIVDSNETDYTLQFVSDKGSVTTNELQALGYIADSAVQVAKYIQLTQATAPIVVGNRLYNVGGALYWNNFRLDSDAGGSGGGGLDSSYVQAIVDSNETDYTLQFVTDNGSVTTNSITVEDATINGLITIADSTAAPAVTTNKLYAVGGRLYWNAFILDSDKFGGGSAIFSDSAYVQPMIDSSIGLLNILDSTNVQTLIDASAYTANQIMDFVQTLDSNASGLNADTLDGQQGSYYLAYGNFTGTPNVLDSGHVQSIVDSNETDYTLDFVTGNGSVTTNSITVEDATINGLITISDSTASPIVTTNKLYAVAGALYWNAFRLDSDKFNTGETANSIMSKIQTLDSNGSGLNADLLDGQQGTFYLDYNNFTNTPNVLDSAQIQAMTDSNEVGYTLDFVTGNGNTTTNDITVNKLFAADSSVMQSNLTVDSDLTVSGDILHIESTIRSTTATTSATSPVAVATFNKTTYGGAEMLVYIRRGSEREVTKLIIAHDNTEVYFTVYGDVTTSAGDLATFTVQVNGNDIEVIATPTSATSTTFNVSMTLLIA